MHMVFIVDFKNKFCSNGAYIPGAEGKEQLNI